MGGLETETAATTWMPYIVLFIYSFVIFKIIAILVFYCLYKMYIMPDYIQVPKKVCQCN